MKALGKELVLRSMRFAGLMAAARRRHRGGARILAYHGVDPDAARRENFDGFHVSPEVFESHLRVLTKRFRVVPLGEIVDALAERRAIPRDAVAITFDDGYANNLAVAAPLLEKFGCPATFFLTSGFIDGTTMPWWYAIRSMVKAPSDIVAMESEIKDLPVVERDRRLKQFAPVSTSPYPFLTWTQARELAGKGFEIGAHTVRHVALSREDERTTADEIEGSFKRIEEAAGVKPRLFAFPYGRSEDATSAALASLRRAQCAAAVTTCNGLVQSGVDAFRLPRYNVTGHHTAAAVEFLIS